MSKICLNALDKVRIVKDDHGQFFDVTNESTNNQCLTTEVYEMHSIVIKRKDRVIKTFVFDNVEIARDYIYNGFWKDAEVIFTNVQ